MIEQAQSLWSLILIALSLGIKHGFDLDHLATIDSISRSVKDRPVLSRSTGLLFSLGHGIIVIIVSYLMGSGLIRSHIPDWLEGVGLFISVGCLLLFGVLNVAALFFSNRSADIPKGIKSLIAKKLTQRKVSPIFICSIGALFAFSFDTFSQVALFSLAASLTSGSIAATVLGLFFMVGMILSDGINGLVIGTFIYKADKASLIVSQSLGIIIAIFSLSIALITLIQSVL